MYKIVYYLAIARLPFSKILILEANFISVVPYFKSVLFLCYSCDNIATDCMQWNIYDSIVNISIVSIVYL